MVLGLLLVLPTGGCRCYVWYYYCGVRAIPQQRK